MLRGIGNIDEIVIRRHKDCTGKDGWVINVMQGKQLMLVPPFYSKTEVNALVDFIKEVVEACHGQSKKAELTEQAPEVVGCSCADCQTAQITSNQELSE